MKYLLTILLLSSVSLSWSQSTEIGMRAGATDNFKSTWPKLESDFYFATVLEPFIHWRTNKRISYELSINYFHSWDDNFSNYTWFDAPPAFAREHQTILTKDYNFNCQFSVLYQVASKKFRCYIGFEAGLMATNRTARIIHEFLDTSAIFEDAYHYHPVNLTGGICNVMTYQLSKKLFFNTKVAFQIIEYLAGGWEYENGVFRPTNMISINLGLSYNLKMFHVEH